MLNPYIAQTIKEIFRYCPDHCLGCVFCYFNKERMRCLSFEIFRSIYLDLIKDMAVPFLT